ncbi:MAG: hypothetical protein ACI89D_000431 [Bermanella sp.]|jgi:hypothetical protein
MCAPWLQRLDVGAAFELDPSGSTVAMSRVTIKLPDRFAYVTDSHRCGYDLVYRVSEKYVVALLPGAYPHRY